MREKLEAGQKVYFRVMEVRPYSVWGTDGRNTYLSLVIDRQLKVPEGAPTILSELFKAGDICTSEIILFNHTRNRYRVGMLYHIRRLDDLRKIARLPEDL